MEDGGGGCDNEGSRVCIREIWGGCAGKARKGGERSGGQLKARFIWFVPGNASPPLSPYYHPPPVTIATLLAYNMEFQEV